jgi:hypothetical protein
MAHPLPRMRHDPLRSRSTIPRVIPRLLNTLAAVSLLLCVATVLLWAAGGWDSGPRVRHLGPRWGYTSTPGECRGEGASGKPAVLGNENHPHPNPLPEYRARGPEPRIAYTAASCMQSKLAT